MDGGWCWVKRGEEEKTEKYIPELFSTERRGGGKSRMIALSSVSLFLSPRLIFLRPCRTNNKINNNSN